MSTNQNKIRILSVDDHPLLREGVARVINDQLDMTVVAQAASGAEAVEQFRQYRPDITLLDLRLPDMSGVDVLMTIRAEFNEARIVVLTTAEGDVEIQRSLQAGARAYVLRSMPPGELTQIIRQVHQGKRCVPPAVAMQLAEHTGTPSLTVREIEVLSQVARGNRNKDIGSLLFISEETVKAHIRNIMEKLGANDRSEAVAIAVRRGIMHL